MNTQIAGLIVGMLFVIRTPPDTCYNEMMIKEINVPPEQFCKQGVKGTLFERNWASEHTGVSPVYLTMWES